MDLHWRIEDDGSYAIHGGPLVLSSGYPGWDGGALRPRTVEVQREEAGGRIRYRLAEGELVLELGRADGDLRLAARLSGLRRAPRQLALLHRADCAGAVACFRQGRGFGSHNNRSGCLPLPREGAEIASESLFALLAVDGGLIIASEDPRPLRCEFHLRPGLEVEDAPRLEAAYHSEGMPLDGELVLPALRIRSVENLYEGLRAMAQQVADHVGRPKPKPTPLGWCSWYHHYDFMNATVLAETLRGLVALPAEERPDYVQIDDGYMTHAGDWLEPNHRFPGGLSAAFAAIEDAGFAAGIWVAPFMVGSRSRLAREHPEWLVHDLDGSPHVQRRQYHRWRIGGDGDEELHVLDVTHPQARERLHDIFATLRSWGATAFKTDFLDMGLIPAHRCRRHDPSCTSASAIGTCLDTIRSAIGDDAYLLGCIGPFAQQLGRVDGCRVATDTSPALGSFYAVFRDTVGVQHLNQTWFHNDPDCLLLREEHNHKPFAEVRADALWCGMLGGLISTGDPIHRYDARRRALWRFIAPGGTSAVPRPWRQERPGEQDLYGLIRAGRDGTALLLLNRSGDDRRAAVVPVAEVLGDDSAQAWLWDPAGAQALGERRELTAELVPREAVLWWLSASGTPPPSRLADIGEPT